MTTREFDAYIGNIKSTMALAADQISDQSRHIQRLERDNAALLTACKAIRERAKDLHSRWDSDELNDSHFSKNLMAIAGYTRGYHESYDQLHEAINQAEKP